MGKYGTPEQGDDRKQLYRKKKINETDRKYIRQKK